MSARFLKRAAKVSDEVDDAAGSRNPPHPPRFEKVVKANPGKSGFMFRQRFGCVEPRARALYCFSRVKDVVKYARENPFP
jgi:hypothetical protein